MSNIEYPRGFPSRALFHAWCSFASWCVAFALEKEVSLQFCATQNVYVLNTCWEIAFIWGKISPVSEGRRWLNSSTSLSWSQDSPLVLPGAAHTLGSENGRENSFNGKKSNRLNSLNFSLNEVKQYSWACCEAWSTFCNWDLNLKGKLFVQKCLDIFWVLSGKQPLTEEILSGFSLIISGW